MKGGGREKNKKWREEKVPMTLSPVHNHPSLVQQLMQSERSVNCLPNGHRFLLNIQGPKLNRPNTQGSDGAMSVLHHTKAQIVTSFVTAEVFNKNKNI